MTCISQPVVCVNMTRLEDLIGTDMPKLTFSACRIHNHPIEIEISPVNMQWNHFYP